MLKIGHNSVIYPICVCANSFQCDLFLFQEFYNVFFVINMNLYLTRIFSFKIKKHFCKAVQSKRQPVSSHLTDTSKH